MRDLLVSKLQAVLEGSDPNRVPENPILQEICNKQRQIKWEHLMCGRFTLEWATHHRTQPGQKRTLNQSWTVEVIDFIFTQWWQLWEMRNQDRHGCDLSTQQQVTARQVDRELQLFYANYETTAPQYLRWLFDMSFEVRQQWPPYVTRQWLTTWQQLFCDALNPATAPTNPENYPYSTELETG